MSKQAIKISVLPADATEKGVTCTLSNKDIADVTPISGGVEVTAKSAGTAELELTSHYNEVTKKVPINIGETTTLAVDGEAATGSMFVKDMGAENELVPYSIPGVKTHRNQENPSINRVSITGTEHNPRFTTTGTQDPYYRPVATPNGGVLKRSTKYTVTFDYNVKPETFLRVRIVTTSAQASYFEGTGKGVVTFTTGATGGQYVSFDPTRVKSAGEVNSSQVGDWYEVYNVQLVEGEYMELPYKLAPEEHGVVHGQPNLIDGTSSELKQITTPAWFYIWKTFEIGKELAVGNTVSARAYIVAPADAPDAKVRLRAVVGETYVEQFGQRIPPGSAGYSSLEFTIPQGCTRVMFMIMTGTETAVLVSTKDEKFIKGSLAAMDEWAPSQAEFNKIYAGRPNLLPMANFVGMSNLTAFNRNWTIESPGDLKHELLSNGVKFQTQVANRRMYNVVGTNWGRHEIGKTYTSLIEVTMQKGAVIGFGQYNTVYSQYTANYTGKHLFKWCYVPVEATAVSMFFGTPNVPYIVHRVKICEGDHPLQFDPVVSYSADNAKVPFSREVYADMLSADKTVKSETKLVDSYSELGFTFNVLDTVKGLYPELSLDTTKLKKLITAMKVPYTARGGGLNNGTPGNFCVVYMKTLAGGYWGVNWGDNVNRTDQLVPITTVGWDATHIAQLSDEGTYSFVVRSNNGNNTGYSSDGVTPAWVEVKDIKLEVTIQPPEDPNAEPITVTVSPS